MTPPIDHELRRGSGILPLPIREKGGVREKRPIERSLPHPALRAHLSPQGRGDTRMPRRLRAKTKSSLR